MSSEAGVCTPFRCLLAGDGGRGPHALNPRFLAGRVGAVSAEGGWEGLTLGRTATLRFIDGTPRSRDRE